MDAELLKPNNYLPFVPWYTGENTNEWGIVSLHLERCPIYIYLESETTCYIYIFIYQKWVHIRCIVL